MADHDDASALSSARPAAGSRCEDVQLAVELPMLWLVRAHGPRAPMEGAMLSPGSDSRHGCASPIRRRSSGSRVRCSVRCGPSVRPAGLRARSRRRGEPSITCRFCAARSPRGWQATLELQGAAHLDARSPRVMGRCCGSRISASTRWRPRRRCCGAGYRVWHLSRPEHGFSKSTARDRVVQRHPGRRRSPSIWRAASSSSATADGGDPRRATAPEEKRNRFDYGRRLGKGQRLAASRLSAGASSSWRSGRLAWRGLRALRSCRCSPCAAPIEDTIRVIIEQAPVGPGRRRYGRGACRGRRRHSERCWSVTSARYPAEWRDWKKLELPAETSGYAAESCR